MKIISLILEGFRGFQLRQIDKFHYRPSKKTQIILGSNGSGKSSTMRELSPLPAVASDYTKNGKKIITIDHNGKHYILSSLFENGSARYIFEVDGENLNPGGTQTVYRELCKTHFNYTPEIHLLLTGKTKFRSMSVAERRSWFMKISDCDYTYAVKFHNKLKDKVRDLQGALKINQARLSQELVKCLSDKDELELRYKVTKCNRILSFLLEHRKPKLSNPSQYHDRINYLEDSLEANMARLEKLLLTIDSQGSVLPVEVLEEQSVGFQVSLQSLQREISERCEKLEQYQKDLEVIRLSSVSSLEEIKIKIKDLEESENDLLRRLRYQFSFEDPRNALTSFEACRPDIESILVELSELPRLTYKKEDYDKLLQLIPILKQDILTAQKLENECFLKKQAMETSKAKGQLECPDCHHKWFQDFTEAGYQVSLKNHSMSIEVHNEAKKRLESSLKEIEEYELFSSLLTRLRRIFANFTTLDPLWNYIKASDLLLTKPLDLQAQLNGYYFDLQVLVKIDKIKTEIKEAQKLEALMVSTKALDKDKIEKEIKKETDLVTEAQNKYRQNHICLEQTKNKIKILSQIQEHSQLVNVSLQERSSALRYLIEDKCIETLDEIINSVRLVVSQSERQLSQVDIQRGIVKNLKEQAEAIESELRLLKMAQQALSPTEGLIAKGMTGFINHFVKQINEFISGIWLYPLELIPIEIKEDENFDLDYKFAVRVNNDTRIVPDISFCSAGMQEIIDLAFVAVSMKYLGLANYPFFLDEFATALDPAHRQSAYKAIDHIIQSSNYSQVYLVSHYQEGYSALTGSEVLVLCDNNVQMPEHLTYNKHVTMS